MIVLVMFFKLCISVLRIFLTLEPLDKICCLILWPTPAILVDQIIVQKNDSHGSCHLVMVQSDDTVC